MVGKYEVIVSSGRDEFNFEVSRKYSVVRGWSGTGKSLLVSLINQSKIKNKGVFVKCKVPVKAIMDYESVKGLGKCIAVLDEDVVDTLQYLDNFKTFISWTRHLDAYFVLITRKNMPAIPYSALEIYSLDLIDRSGRKRKYTLNRMYHWESNKSVAPSCVLTEDSNSGFQFMSAALKIDVYSSFGKSNLSVKVKELYSKGYSSIFIVADGAALGSEINSLVQLLGRYKDLELYLYAPESFEYILLKSEIFKKFSIRRFLEETYNYADSRVFMSWKQYYTSLISKLSKQFSVKDSEYSKSKLSKFYTKPGNMLFVLKEMEELDYVKVVGEWYKP